MEEGSEDSALLVDGGTTDNMPVSDLVVDSVPRLGVFLRSDDADLPPGNYGLRTLAPRIIDLMLASNETVRIAADRLAGATIATWRPRRASGSTTTAIGR